MRKDSRLSFRISPKLSSRIDLAVKKSKGEIKDRSEFGTKAVDFYIKHILTTDNEAQLIGKSILTIADRLNISGDEIQAVKNMIYDHVLSPIENHPKFDDLMILRERLPRELKKSLSQKLFIAKYAELEKIYDEYSKKYYLIGKGEDMINKRKKVKVKAT